LSVFFVYTSALAKRYLNEIGSTWVRGWIRASTHNEIIIAESALVEMLALLSRRKREKSVTTARFARIKIAFQGHVKQDYLVIDMRSSVIMRASELVEKHPLRTLDALQLACALEAQNLLNVPVTFVSADNNLLNMAANEGFQTDNPNIHP
jgi:uncharacterized protein